MTQEELRILQHSLGVDHYGRGRQYRNHYCGDSEACRTLVTRGLMVEHPPSELTGGNPLFVVTREGRKAMAAESPKPPRVSRSQQRYLNFLKQDCSLTFGECLRRGVYKEWEAL